DFAETTRPTLVFDVGRDLVAASGRLRGDDGWLRLNDGAHVPSQPPPGRLREPWASIPTKYFPELRTCSWGGSPCGKRAIGSARYFGATSSRSGSARG